ncbi:MAG: HK97 family phage prohead protease [Caulobacteraceae bacterium]|nr:HK97 family phage prohead protease [Caulobacteraceae bacterium]
MKIYGEITKIEDRGDGTIRVSGVASSGAVDEADETVLPAAMKAALPAYMRFGALREMHGLSAAGATLSAEVGDDGLTRIETHVVDPMAVRKVKLGVYKGFSIGGRVLERDPADRKVITKLKLNEISLVDRPCNPEATIDMWKADRAEAAASTTVPTNAAVIAKAIELAAAAGKRGRYADFVVKARQMLVEATSAAEVEASPRLAASESEAGAVRKAGARNSKADLALIQAAHDHLAALGARCGGCADDEDDEDDDAAGWDDETDDGLGPEADQGDDDGDDVASSGLKTAAAGLAGSRRIEALQRTVERLEKRLEDLAREPAPPKTFAGLARAVSKAEDASPGGSGGLSAGELKKYLDGLPEEERGRLQREAISRMIQRYTIGMKYWSATPSRWLSSSAEQRMSDSTALRM